MQTHRDSAKGKSYSLYALGPNLIYESILPTQIAHMVSIHGWWSNVKQLFPYYLKVALFQWHMKKTYWGSASGSPGMKDLTLGVYKAPDTVGYNAVPPTSAQPHGTSLTQEPTSSLWPQSCTLASLAA